MPATLTRPETLGDSSNQAVWKAPVGSGWRECGIAFLWACLIAGPIAAVGGGMIYSDWRQKEDARIAAAEAALAHERLVAAEPQPTLPREPTAHGRDVFMSACIACHGPDGTGIAGLGRNLTVSDFVALKSDAELTAFLIAGRPTAKPVPMPPRAGRDDLTDDDLIAVVSYLRGLQDPRRMPELPAYTAAAPSPLTDSEIADALAAAGGDEELAEYIASGSKLFAASCIACHGAGGVGMKGNGKPLVNSEFIQSLDDDGLLAFIKRGRDPSDPKNTTGVGMPAKGGNPALSDDDILDIIAYLRTLQPSHSVSVKN